MSDLAGSLVVEASADGCNDCLVLLAAHDFTSIGVGVATDNIWALQRNISIIGGMERGGSSHAWVSQRREERGEQERS
jgi:hypothetical protein